MKTADYKLYFDTYRLVEGKAVGVDYMNLSVKLIDSDGFKQDYEGNPESLTIGLIGIDRFTITCSDPVSGGTVQIESFSIENVSEDKNPFTSSHISASNNAVFEGEVHKVGLPNAYFLTLNVLLKNKVQKTLSLRLMVM